MVYKSTNSLRQSTAYTRHSHRHPPSCLPKSFRGLLVDERSKVYIHRQLKCRLGYLREALTQHGQCVPHLNPVVAVIASVVNGIFPKHVASVAPLSRRHHPFEFRRCCREVREVKVLRLLNNTGRVLPTGVKTGAHWPNTRGYYNTRGYSGLSRLAKRV